MHSTTTFELSATTAANSDCILPVVTAPSAFAQKLVEHRYVVELVFGQAKLQDNCVVRASTRTIDAVVQAPTLDAIKSLIAACSWLEGYEVISYNEPDFERVPF